MKKRLQFTLLYLFGVIVINLLLVITLIQGLVIDGRAFNLAKSMDQHGNAVLRGDMDETISERAARNCFDKKKQRWCLLCRILSWFDPDHCKKVHRKPDGAE